MRDDAHAEWVDAEAKSATANRKWQMLLNAEASADARFRQEVQELKDAMVANKIDIERQFQAELTAERETNSLVYGREASELRAATASLTAEVNSGREKDRELTAELREVRTHQGTNDAMHERERTLRKELEAHLAEVSAKIVSDSATLTGLNLELRSEQAACRDLLSECRDLDADRDWFREEAERRGYDYDDADFEEGNAPGPPLEVEGTSSIPIDSPISMGPPGLETPPPARQAQTAPPVPDSTAAALSGLTRALELMATAQAAALSRPDTHADLLKALSEQHRESGQKIRAPTPKLTAADAETLRSELILLKRYFNEAKVTDRKAWFKLLRNVVTGSALAELN